jgi:uncharacterized protein
MRRVIETLYFDFLERTLPATHPRDLDLEPLPGKALALIGMRRVGKTFACYDRIRSLLASGMDKQNILYLNFEDDRLFGFRLGDCQTILDVFYADRPQKKSEPCAFFFDEIQNIPGWERFIRRLLDTESAAITITGSSAKLLSAEIATGMRGRSLDREVFPYSFREFLRAIGQQPEFARPGHQTRLKLIQESQRYCRKGGLPELLSIDAPHAREVAQSYVDAVVLRDVAERHGVSNLVALRALLYRVLRHPAQKLSVNKLYLDFKSRGLRIGKDDLYAFLRHLCDAYLLFQLPLWTDSEAKRQVNPKKFYVIDNGILDAYSTTAGSDNGAFFENLVYLTLRREGYHLGYYETRQGYEIDFVYECGGQTCLVQACWSLEDDTTRQREIRALCEAAKAFGNPQKLIVTLQEEWTDAATGIQAQPLWKFLIRDHTRL